jgi:uncharacterized protein YcfJ
MNKLLAAITTVVAIGATPVFAQTEYATIVKVTPNYQNVSTPRYRTDCQTVEVPIYGGRSQASTADTFVGALIGGAIGNQFGGGSGKDAATVLGAIVGADVANKKGGQQQIIGYRQEQVCQNVTFYETQEQIKNYTVTYEWNGLQGRTVTYNNYRVGDRIPVSVSIQAK